MIIKTTALLLLLCLGSTTLSHAQDSPSHQNSLITQSSEFEPPKASDRQFVRNDQPGELDTGCTPRSQGPLEIVIPVDRVITKFDPVGEMSEYNAALNNQIAKQYLSPKVTIQMPVFDVDSPLEVDRVLLNGHPIGILYGQNNTWTLNTFEVDIRLLNFGKFADLGTPAQPGENVITIDINTTNHPSNWCTSIDWVSARFSAMSPIILIHGNSSNGAFFDRQGLVPVLKNQSLLYDDSLNMSPASNFIDSPAYDDAGNIISQPNNFQINQHLKKAARAFGVDSMHLVMHSKGGLDTRSYLAVYQPINNKDFKILSYTSIGTPHNGSILADIVTQRAEAAKYADRIEFGDNFPDYSRQVFALSGPSRGHYNLTKDYLRGFNQRNIRSLVPSETQFNAIAADADKDRNGAISVSVPFIPREDAELAREGSNDWVGSSFPLPVIPTVMYRTIRDVHAIRVETTTITRTIDGVDVTFRIPRFIGSPPSTPQYNDTLVSKESGFGIGTFAQVVSQSNGRSVFYEKTGETDDGANHATIIARSTGDVLLWIWSADLRKGDWDR